MRVREPEDALKYKLVDGLMYKDEILAQLRTKLGIAQKSEIKAVEISDYTKSDMSSEDDDSKTGTSDGRIAMIYASGEISGGEGDDNSIGSEGISKALRKARTDSKIKAVVFRVNSPGGSALASEVIWREVELTKKVKPIVVSMGDVAASGGYYISCAADSIIAEPNTITGSIGIFSVLFNMQKLFNDKLGVTFDGVKTGKFADIGDMSRPLTAQERFILQTQINHGYDTFTGRVATGRHKTKAYIDSIGQGRVWTGEQALKIGLVDRLGNIDDAVKCAARMAHVKSYRLVSYPEQKSFLNKLGLTTSTELKTYLVKSELGPNYKLYQKLQSVTQMARAPQARMLYDVEVN
jgi:protease-4